MHEVTSVLSKWLKQVLEEYGVFIVILFIGFVIGWKLKYLLSDKKFMSQVELRLADKDQQILDLKVLVYERLRNVEVTEKDKTFFKKIKAFFKNLPKRKKT